MLDPKFVEGLYYALCQKQATNSDLASIMSHAKSVRDAVNIIKKSPKAEVFLNAFHSLSFNWIDHIFCVGEQPSHFQAFLLVQAGINRFVDVTDSDQTYFEILPENVAYYKATISNDSKNGQQPVELAAKSVLDALARNERVYLHCRSGLCRSAIIASVVTAIRMKISYTEAIKIVKSRRPVAQPQLDLFCREDADAVIKRLSDAKS